MKHLQSEKEGVGLVLELQNMEQKKISKRYENNSNNNNGARRDEDGYIGVPIHSQIMKIKQEFEKIKHLQQLDMRWVLREINQQRSRSPLGLAERPISVGHL